MAVTLRIPVCAHLVTIDAGSQVVDPGWDRLRLDQVLTETNGIWAQADIRFELRSAQPQTVQLPGTGNTVVDRSAFFFLASRFGRRQEPNLALVRSVSERELGGRSAEELNFCLIPYGGTIPALGKQLAHEFGHLLGLDHPDGPRQATTSSHVEGARHVYNLMYSGLSAETRLTDEQVRAARSSTLARHFEVR